MSTTTVLVSNPWSSTTSLASDVKDDGLSELSDFVSKVARLELREDKHTREECLKQLREWISKNPDLENCITDDSFLLRFLRAKKFSLTMAQQTLLKYLNLRQRFSDVFFNMDYLDPKVNEIISSGYIFASPFRDSNGRRVTFTIGSNFDPKKFSSSDMAKAHVITYETLLDDEPNQILGITHLGDAINCGAAYVTLWSINEFITLIRWGEQSYPMRHKEIHVLHIHPLVKYVYDFIRTIISPKLRSRIFIYDSPEELHKGVDPKVLPKEYGGTMPMAEMIELWKKELALKRNRLLSYDKIRLLSDRGIIRRKNKPNANDGTIEGLPGSFRKLEVD